MIALVVAIFVLVYAGMIVGRVPGLALDRTGIALAGASVLLAASAVSPEAALASTDWGTLGLLFGLMTLAGALTETGFYEVLADRVGHLRLRPKTLLLGLILLSAALSALLTNDVVCLALAPLVLGLASSRKLPPEPYLLGLAAASNIGSAATLVGNPQNILIGERLALPFLHYLLVALPPVVASLAVLYVFLQSRVTSGPSPAVSASPPPASRRGLGSSAVPLGLLGLLALAFCVAPELSRPRLAMGAAALALISRRIRTEAILRRVDFGLLCLFAALFVCHGALDSSGILSGIAAALDSNGVRLDRPAWLIPTTFVLSNLVSNVPATMLLLPHIKDPSVGPLMALVSTLAGNLLVVGSLANIIVVTQAERAGLIIGYRAHARVGVPVTLLSVLITSLWWLALRGW